MAKCKYYREEEINAVIYDVYGIAHHATEIVGKCCQTKDRHECYCKGNKLRCDFYNNETERRKGKRG